MNNHIILESKAFYGYRIKFSLMYGPNRQFRIKIHTDRFKSLCISKIFMLISTLNKQFRSNIESNSIPIPIGTSPFPIFTKKKKKITIYTVIEVPSLGEQGNHLNLLYQLCN